MLVDEEGLLKNKPLNLAGCYLYETDKRHSPIVGDILIMRERNYDFAGLEPQDFKVLFELISLAERAGG
jgi:hypothetical protein